MSLPSKEEVFEALRPITDPEMNVSIVDLGLIYDVEAEEEDSRLHVKMTLTSPMCPVGPQIMGAVHTTCLQLENVEDVDVQLVWTPPWDPRAMATEDVKMMLGIWD
ncbi:MAG TPA: metal-sulfur cluster assembly factor [Acidobacteriota bacterium]|nr:metal-sulfur cluster assembly factor [Acidobacteriota bacterium]